MGHLAHRALDTLGELAEALAGIADHPADQRRDRDEHQCQLPVGPEQIAQQAEHEEAFAQDDGQRLGGRAGDLLDMVGDACDEMAGGVLVEIAPRQVQHVVEHRGTQGVHHVARHITHAVGAQEGADAAHGEHADHEQRQEQSELGVRILNAVDQALHHLGQRRTRGTVDDVADDGGQKHLPVRANIAEQAAVMNPGGVATHGVSIDLGGALMGHPVMMIPSRYAY